MLEQFVGRGGGAAELLSVKERKQHNSSKLTQTLINYT